MAWSKGAVVVVKRGDPGMADEMEKIFKSNVKGSGGGYCFLPHKHSPEELKAMMEDAQRLYGKRGWSFPEWFRPIKEGMAFIVYHVCLFIDKYLKI